MNFFISQEQPRFQETDNEESGLLPVPAEERTMFVTFSKGYPVAEWEVTDFLTTNYGDCIESFYMQNVVGAPNNHPLFARVVFFSPSTIDRILNGAATAKFSINAKNVWMRKFVPQSPRISPSDQQGPNRNTSFTKLDSNQVILNPNWSRMRDTKVM